MSSQPESSQLGTIQPSVEGDTRHLPVVVYGTLRPGQSNYDRILAGRTLSERPVVIPGYRMYSNFHYPFIVPHADAQSYIIGDLVTVPEKLWEQTIWDLDFLEGYQGFEADTRNLYDRVVVKVKEDNRMFDAYLYVANASMHEEILFDMPLIPTGDWIVYSAK